MDEQSQEWFRELKVLDGKHRILKRCCRAILNGAITINEIEDPVLMNVYKPKLIFCPECGEVL